MPIFCDHQLNESVVMILTKSGAINNNVRIYPWNQKLKIHLNIVKLMTNFSYNYITCVCSVSKNIQAQLYWHIQASVQIRPSAHWWPHDICRDGWEKGTTAPRITE